MMILSRTPSAGIEFLRLLLATWIVASQPVMLCAQVSPEEHASHHPGQAGAAARDGGAGPAPAQSPATAGGEMGGMMDDMMEKMGAPQPKELYPRLMDLPDLPMEERAQIEHQAHQRMMDGTKLLSAGLDELAIAAATDDFATMQAAAAKLREGLAQFESGLAAHRAIREGKAPRNVAVQWFKHEMNLASPIPRDEPHTLLGVTPFHLFTMALLVAFALAMIVMYFFKMRRAAALFGRIEASKGAPPPGSAPALAGSAPLPTASADKPAADAKGT
jgi:hypothetical protein